MAADRKRVYRVFAAFGLKESEDLNRKALERLHLRLMNSGTQVRVVTGLMPLEAWDLSAPARLPSTMVFDNFRNLDLWRERAFNQCARRAYSSVMVA